MHLRGLLLAICAISSASAAETLAQRVARIVKESPAFAGGFAGVHVIELTNNKVLAEVDSAHLFVPASNAKLFSTSLALTRLGPDYRFRTRVLAAAQPGAGGVLESDLVLYGGGDPTMSNRRMPYDPGPAMANPMEPVDQLADKVVAQGIRVIRGDIVGDDSAYEWEPYPPGWAQDDTVWEYGSPVSALTFNHNSVVVGVKPGRAGEPPELSPDPAFEYFTFDNRLRTVETGETAIKVERGPGSSQVTLRGTVVAGAEVFPLWLAVDDPALYAATALYDALVRRGVNIHGRARCRHRRPGDPPSSPPSNVVAERVSPPLAEILQVVDKVSSNLWAELCLREVARVRTGNGTLEAGLAEEANFLREVGIPATDYTFSDASGLSRLTLVAPRAVTTLLAFMSRSGNAKLWRGLLPIGGFDGTLIKRFEGQTEGRRVQAKTGSLTHVNSLSGYATSRTYGELAFSILVNNTGGNASDVRDAIDRIGLALVQ